MIKKIKNRIHYNRDKLQRKWRAKKAAWRVYWKQRWCDHDNSKQLGDEVWFILKNKFLSWDENRYAIKDIQPGDKVIGVAKIQKLYCKNCNLYHYKIKEEYLYTKEELADAERRIAEGKKLAAAVGSEQEKNKNSITQ